jgi:hypothetical protein
MSFLTGSMGFFWFRAYSDRFSGFFFFFFFFFCFGSIHSFANSCYFLIGSNGFSADSVVLRPIQVVYCSIRLLGASIGFIAQGEYWTSVYKLLFVVVDRCWLY